MSMGYELRVQLALQGGITACVLICRILWQLAGLFRVRHMEKRRQAPTASIEGHPTSDKDNKTDDLSAVVRKCIAEGDVDDAWQAR